MVRQFYGLGVGNELTLKRERAHKHAREKIPKNRWLPNQAEQDQGRGCSDHDQRKISYKVS